jgi:hypothetical protein
VVTAAIAAIVTWLITPAVSQYAAVKTLWSTSVDLVQDDPPPPPASDQIVDAYQEQTRTAAIWAKPPTMFRQGAAAMRRQFARFDPRRSHRYEKTRFKMWIPDLVRQAPLFAGLPVEVVGRVVNVNLLDVVSEKEAEWIVQLAPVTTNDGLVYCRVTAPVRMTFPQHLVARGTVIAAGGVALQRGGYAPAVYMACSAVRRPYGEIGRFTRFVEASGIDMAAISDEAKSESDLRRRIARAMAKAVRRNPALITYSDR